jgi:release factor glutamine methyltransferase
MNFAQSTYRTLLSNPIEFIRRRLRHEPLQYILSEWDFRKINLDLERPVFIPRPETEELVSIALEL